jgi:hypothetical protein
MRAPSNDLEQRFDKVHKLVKLAQRNTAKDQEAARRIAKEMSFTGRNELSLPETNVIELTAACAKARQSCWIRIKYIVKLRFLLPQWVQAETNALTEQVSPRL